MPEDGSNYMYISPDFLHNWKELNLTAFKLQIKICLFDNNNNNNNVPLHLKPSWSSVVLKSLQAV